MISFKLELLSVTKSEEILNNVAPGCDPVHTQVFSRGQPTLVEAGEPAACTVAAAARIQ